MNNGVLISAALLFVAGGLYLYSSQKKEKENDRSEIKKINESDLDAIKFIFDSYYKSLYDDRFEYFWCNDIRLSFSISQITNNHKNTVEYKNSLNDFDLTGLNRSTVKAYILNKIKETVSDVPEESTVDQLIFLYEYTQLSAQKDALEKAQQEFDIKSKDETYYNELLAANLNKMNRIVAKIKA